MLILPTLPQVYAIFHEIIGKMAAILDFYGFLRDQPSRGSYSKLVTHTSLEICPKTISFWRFHARIYHNLYKNRRISLKLAAILKLKMRRT